METKKSLIPIYELEFSDGISLKIHVKKAKTGILSIILILEDFYNLFIYKRFEGKDKIEVTNWQPCLFLRFAVSCYQCHSS